MIIKEPPHNLEVEQQIIGALIKDPTHSNSRETMDSMGNDDFYSMAHRLTFNCIKKMTERKENVDLITLEERLGSDLASAGGFIYLAELNKNTTGTYQKLLKKQKLNF